RLPGGSALRSAARMCKGSKACTAAAPSDRRRPSVCCRWSTTKRRARRSTTSTSIGICSGRRTTEGLPDTTGGVSSTIRPMKTLRFVLALCLVPVCAYAETVRVEITSRKDIPQYGYEEITGKAYFRLDPKEPHNKVIADID